MISEPVKKKIFDALIMHFNNVQHAYSASFQSFNNKHRRFQHCTTSSMFRPLNYLRWAFWVKSFSHCSPNVLYPWVFSHKTDNNESSRFVIMDLTNCLVVATRDISLNFHYRKLTIISNKCRYNIAALDGDVSVCQKVSFLARYCRSFFSIAPSQTEMGRKRRRRRRRDASNEPLVAIRRVWMSVPVQSHLVAE